MKSKWAVAVLLTGVALGAQTAQAPVPVTQEHHHHLILENEYVRVYDVEVDPHSTTLVHEHDLDYAYVTLGDSRITNAVTGKPPVDADVPDAHVSFAKGGFAHAAINRADTPFRNVTIEFKRPERRYLCGIEGTPACAQPADPHVRVVFETDELRTQMTTLAPGEQTAVHTHDRPHLAVAVDDLTLESDAAGQKPRTFSMKAGDAVFTTERVTHSLKNVGTKRARMLAIEFAP